MYLRVCPNMKQIKMTSYFNQITFFEIADEGISVRP